MQAKDFYFQLVRQMSGNFFLITPISLYDIDGILSDESGVADEVLPEGFYELTESTYEYQGTPETGRQLLIDIGMKEINFGFQPGEPSLQSDNEVLMEDDVEDDNEIDNLLYYNTDEQHSFDYNNISTDKLIRHLNVMISTEAFEEAAKIKIELNSRGVTEFLK